MNTFRFLLPQYWPVWLLFGIGWCIARLPYPRAVGLGRKLGRFMMMLSKSRRYVAQRNIEVCFPDLPVEQQQKLVRESFESLGIAFIEIAIAYWGSAGKIAPLTHVSGLEHIKAAQANGQGVFIIASHMTSLELCLRMFAESQPCATMYKPIRNPLVEAYTYAKRARYTLPIHNKDLRNFLDYVRQGGVGIYLPDQHYGARNSVFAPFFNIWCTTITRAREFVEQTNAQVLPVVFGRREDGYDIQILPPIEYPTEDPVADATHFNQIIENNVRQYPDQYLWQHRRFKRVAEFENPVY